MLASKTRLVKTDIWMMEKRLTCLAEITAVLSLLGLRFQVQGSTTLSDIHDDLKLAIVSTRQGNQ